MWRGVERRQHNAADVEHGRSSLLKMKPAANAITNESKGVY
jgi:hypothetical protein